MTYIIKIVITANLVSYLLNPLFSFASVEDKTSSSKDVSKEVVLSGDWRDSIASLKRSIRKDPNSKEPFFLLGKTYFSLGQYRSGMKQFWEVMRIDPDHAGAHAWLGVCFLKRGFSDKAVTEIKRAMKLASQNWQIAWAQGELSFSSGDSKKAERLWLEAIDKRPDHPQIYMSLAQMYLKQKKWDKNAQALESARKMGMDSSVADFILAESMFQQKNYDQALNLFQQVLERRNSKKVFIIRRIGMSFDYLGRTSEAILEYEKYLKMKPRDESMLNAVGLLHIKLRDFDRAVQSFQQVLRINPKNFWAYNNMAIAFRRQGKFDEAIQAHKEAIKIEPSNVSLVYNLGNTYFEKGDYLAAVIYYEKVIKLDPKNDKAFRRMGLSYYNLGNFEETVSYLEKAYEINSFDPSLMDEMGMVRIRKGDYEKAQSWFEQAVKADSKNSLYHQHCGEALVHLKKVDEALREWESAVNLDPENAEVLIEMGDIYFEHYKDRQKARSCYEKVLKLELAPEVKEKVEDKLKEL